MGLDMQLNKKIYIGSNYEHNKITGKIEIFQDGELVNIDFTKITEIIEEAAYWRKANQIHRWFVDNIQEGVDDCGEYYVSYEELLKLVEACKEAIKTKNTDLLPPMEGFFFGSDELDAYYWSGISETIEMLKDLDPQGYYFYSSSW